MKLSWEPLTLRPVNMPSGWTCMQQNTSVRTSESSFARQAKIHHLGEPQNIWACFVEFSQDHSDNKTLKYKYTVRGGRNSKPSEDIKHFANLKDATNYLVFIMESTDKWVEEVNSEATIKAYDKRMIEIKKLTSKIYGDE